MKFIISNEHNIQNQDYLIKNLEVSVSQLIFVASEQMNDTEINPKNDQVVEVDDDLNEHRMKEEEFNEHIEEGEEPQIPEHDHHVEKLGYH